MCMYLVQQKVHQWSGCVHTLSAFAHKQPQAAYAALTHSLQFEWSFTLRVNSGNIEIGRFPFFLFSTSAL